MGIKILTKSIRSILCHMKTIRLVIPNWLTPIELFSFNL